MLRLDREKDVEKMKMYYRASDMLDFHFFFPESSPILNLAIATDVDDYLSNKQYFDSFDSYRVDSQKGYSLITGIESTGGKTDFVELFSNIKKKNETGVILFFDLEGDPSERYERYAGISIVVDMFDSVVIEAVGKGFDGREISKGICVHERYLIPWFEIRSLSIENFHMYNIFLIDQQDYLNTRKNRIEYLKKIGHSDIEFNKYIPVVYEKIPDFIWDDLIRTVIKYLEKKEDLLIAGGYEHFAIGGNSEDKKCFMWQMYNKDRYK